MKETYKKQEHWKVVVSLEKQYSIWPVDKNIPYGWEDCKKQGSKEECLFYIKNTWTDMRPLSLVQQIKSDANEED